MNKSSNELIHRYLLGIATDDEVRELEARLLADEELQGEFLFQSEIDGHLRQEVVDEATSPGLREAHGLAGAGYDTKRTRGLIHYSYWISGISTLAATVLVAIVLFNMSPQPAALAYPSLGELIVDIPQSEQNIWAAVASGDLDAIHREIRNSESVDSRAECGLTPLHIATLADHPAAVELLLAHGADVSLPDREGNTALHMASFLGRTDFVRPLLKAGADPTVRNHLGFSSLDNVAVRWSSGLEDYYHHVEKVLKTTLDLKQIRADRPKILRLLASENTFPSDVTPSVGLWQAAMTGNTAAVEQHLRAGTDLNAREHLGGSTPMTVAAIFGQEQVVRILIDAGANPEIRNHSGGTALHQAAFFCRPEIVNLLLTAGADPHAVNSRGLTALEIVDSDFDTELEGVYRHVYDDLNLTLDVSFVRQARNEIADLLHARLRKQTAEQ